MEKTLAELIDELSIVNNKIFELVGKVQRNEHIREDSTRIQDLNLYRSQLKNAINKKFQERQEIKV